MKTDEMAVRQVTARTPETLVICVGNAYRHDDGVGLRVASLLEAGLRRCQPGSKDEEGLRVVRESGDGGALLEVWRGAENVVLVDAACTGAGAGTIYRLEVPTQPAPDSQLGQPEQQGQSRPSQLVPAALFPCSTHAFGVAEAIDMARALGSLPSRLVIYAIEGADFGPGTGISPEVEEAAQRVAESVLAQAGTAARTRRRGVESNA